MTKAHQCRSEHDVDMKHGDVCNVRDFTEQRCKSCFLEKSDYELNEMREKKPNIGFKYTINCVECEEGSYLHNGECKRIHDCPPGTYEDWYTCLPHHC